MQEIVANSFGVYHIIIQELLDKSLCAYGKCVEGHVLTRETWR
jgi:hypothetical protein